MANPEWKRECVCEHAMNYHRDQGRSSCTYTGCACGQFRPKKEKE